MLIIGVTGGIGSGKSTVTQYFEGLGIPIVDADIVARDIVNPGSRCIQAIEQHFGKAVLLPDGNLNRAKLREIIFSNSSSKQKLESIMHPAIREEIVRQLNALNQGKYSYAILSSPLLIETSQTELVDRVLVVDIEEDEQITRTSQRDGVNKQHVESIMATQASRKQRLTNAHDIVNNASSLECTYQQLKTLHKKYISLSEAHNDDE